MELNKVGLIVSFHGLKGEVKVKSFTDFKDERFKIKNKLYLKKNDREIEVTIKSWRVHKGMDLLAFEEYSDLTSIEHLKNFEIYALKDELDILEEDEFYYKDLIGLSVYDYQDHKIGKIVKINETAANDLFVLDNDVLIPFVKAIVNEIDLENKKITLFEIEGLF